MKTSLIALLSLLLGACAGHGSECAFDSYALGQRDARLGSMDQAETYSARCGAQVDRARYAEGWRDGNIARPIPLW